MSSIVRGAYVKFTRTLILDSAKTTLIEGQIMEGFLKLSVSMLGDTHMDQMAVLRPVDRHMFQ